MRKIIVIQLFLLLFQNLYSQKGNKTLFKEYEDTLKLLSTTIIYATDEEERKLANISFIENLSEVLEYEKSFKYPFELLPKEIILNSPNNHFRMFNWYLRKENNTYEYYAIIQYYNKIKQKYEVINLKDNSENLRKPENKELDANNWFGCYYYDIILHKKDDINIYTLLGWDGNDKYSDKKIIDVMYFSGKELVKFGIPIFKYKDDLKNRIILEYSSKTSISLRYNKKEKKIIFNNLIAPKNELIGFEEYYIPDGSFNAYFLDKEKWNYEKDIDIKNNIKIKKNKKIKKGLFPK